MTHRLALSALALSLVAGYARADHERLLLDRGWRFALGNAADAAKDFQFSSGGFSYLAKAGSEAGPISLRFSDARWRTVDLPHDWAVELPFDPKSDESHGFKPVGRDFPQNSVGWYRRSFDVPKADEGRRLRITFDGAFRDSRVFLNGHYLGRNDSGYAPFSFDITDVAKYGAKNVVSVRVDASEAEGWFYEGAGIYRHVWLDKYEPGHFAEHGVFATSDLKGDRATLTVRAELANDSGAPQKLSPSVAVSAPDGSPAGSALGKAVTLAPGETRTVEMTVPLGKAALWSPENPALYRVRVGLNQDGKEIDATEFQHGVRTLRWDADRGFFLNGRPYKILGTCNHQDHAGVGAALPDSIQDYRVRQLKKMGCNAYRTSHNPPTPELLDACDRLGMLVLDETRQFGSVPEALSQIVRLVKRDRNHPSVFFWSIGNEEGWTHGTPESYRMAKTVIATVKGLDPTRLTTYAGNNGGAYEGINAAVDVRGFNYNLGSADGYHKAHPAQPVHGSEVASAVSTRGIYESDPARGYVSAYDVNAPSWATTSENWWSYAATRDWFAGGFVWTGFDYRGEPTPYSWPCINSHFGVLDTCGFPKDNFYYYRAWWSGQPSTHVFPHWSWPGKEGRPIDVWVHSNADAVELFLNGKSLGKKPMPRNGHLEWKVIYAPGKLEALAFRNDRPAETDSVETTGAPVKLVLTPDRDALSGDGEDAVPVAISAVDARGHAVPTANLKVDLSVEGAGALIGVGNGDPSSHEADVYVRAPRTRALTGWKLEKSRVADLAALLARPGVRADFDDSAWAVGNVDRAESLAVGEGGIWRAAFDLTAEDIAENGWKSLEIGGVDDRGAVFVNGVNVGSPDDWSKSWSFDAARALKPGRNVVTIAAYNGSGAGGLYGGVSLSGKTATPWSRSLFNGLAQAIVRASDRPGTLTVTASAPGLESATLAIPVRRAARRPEVPIP